MALSCPARPHAIEAALQTGRVQAARLVKPEMPRYVAMALAPHGELTLACRTAMRELQVIAAAQRPG